MYEKKEEINSGKKNIVVAGSGPVGLYTAILLKKKYPAENIIVIDSRMSQYQRPGIIAKQAVAVINEGLQNMKIRPIEVSDSGGIPTNNVYIRDLQRALIGRAKDTGVTLVEDSFASIEENEITTKKGMSIPCGMLIDCTGEGRSVAKFVNKQSGKSVFNIEPIGDNPIKNHFIAYVDMDKVNCERYSTKKINSITYSQAMQELRTLGWQEFAEPEFTPTRWDKKESEGGGARFCFYFEIPKSVAEAETQLQEAYLHTLLFLKTGQRIDFTKVDDDLSFIPFDVDPKLVTETVNMQPIPISLCGDALMSPEYRLGTGVSNGVGCANALVASIYITSSGVNFEQEKYIELRKTIVIPHRQRAESEYQSKRNKLSGIDLEQAYEKYEQAFSLLREESENPLLLSIEQGLIDLAVRLRMAADIKLTSGTDRKSKQQLFEGNLKEAIKFYESALTIYQKNCPDLQGAQREIIEDELTKIHSNLSKTYFQLGSLKQSLDYANIASNMAQKYGVMDTGLLELAGQFKSVGNTKFGSKDFKAAVEFYKDAIGIYEKFCDHLQKSHGNIIGSELTKLYSNLAKSYFNLETTDSAIECTEKAIAYAEHYNINDMLAKDKLPDILRRCYLAALNSCEADDWAKKIPLLDKLIKLTIKRDEDPQTHVEELKRLEEIKVLQKSMKEEMSALQSQSKEMTGDVTTNTLDLKFEK